MYVCIKAHFIVCFISVVYEMSNFTVLFDLLRACIDCFNNVTMSYLQGLRLKYQLTMTKAAVGQTFFRQFSADEFCKYLR